MARQPRIEYPGAIYHVMARGDRKEAIFQDEGDRVMFLETLGEVCAKGRWRVYAWVLMNNHYHWVLETPEGNLVAGMKWFQNTYTRRLNSRHRLWGHVFGGRYKAVLVEGEDDTQKSERGDYLATVMDYVHLNPARAGLVTEKRGLMDYRWSSLSQAYAMALKQRAPWMAVPEGLAQFGWPDETRARRSFVERLEERAREERKQAGVPPEAELETLQSTLRRGWYWGSQAFQEKLLKLVDRARFKTNRNYRLSPLAQHSDRELAEKILSEGCRHFALLDERGALIPGRSTQAGRVAVAWALHRKTSQSQKWIADQLGLRTAANVSQQVLRFQRRLDAKETALQGKTWRVWVKFVKIS